MQCRLGFLCVCWAVHIFYFCSYDLAPDLSSQQENPFSLLGCFEIWNCVFMLLEQYILRDHAENQYYISQQLR
jgi:hypothetical protein